MEFNGAAIEQARLQVQGPAIGLLVLGTLELLIAPVIFTVFIELSRCGRDVFVILALIVPALALAVGGLTIVAARENEAARRLRIGHRREHSGDSGLAGPPDRSGDRHLVARGAYPAGSQKCLRLSRRMKPARPPATGFQRTMGIAALVLCLASPPIFILFCCSVPHGSLSGSFMFLLPALEAVALILGILGRKSFAGKAAVIGVGCVFLASSAVYRCGVIGESHTAPWLAEHRSVTSEAATHNSLGRTLADQGRLDEAIQEYRNVAKIQPDNAERTTILAGPRRHGPAR